jgi:hypothetical protein
VRGRRAEGRRQRAEGRGQKDVLIEEKTDHPQMKMMKTMRNNDPI